MSIPASGAISLENLQTVFGGANPIGFNEYYLNATPALTAGVSGIPNIGSAISLNQFYGKSKPVTGGVIEYMIAGNVAGSMDQTGGINMGIDNVDDFFVGIGTVGFSFFWFGTDYGSSNNIQWNTNNVMTFGGGNRQYSNWSPGTGKGVLIGQYDRRTNWAIQFNPFVTNNLNIKRFIVTQANSYSNGNNEIQIEIRLIRGPVYQYIEIRMAYWAAATGGIWNISDGGSFYNVFSGAPPVGTGASVVLRGDLNGYNWQAFNNHYIDQNALPPVPVIPVTTGLYARYTGDGPFTKVGNNITQWNDIGGSDRHITTYRGAPTQVSIAKGLYGTTGTGSFNVVAGTTIDGFQLPFALPQNNNLAVSSYTIIYIARYVGNKDNITGNNRIFDSTATVGNHIWGFHGNVAGRSHNANYGWRTHLFYKQSDPDYWMIGSETELNSRFNGIDWTINSSRSTDNYITPQKSTTTPTFSINFGAYTGDGTNSSECSNWEVAELIFYDRELSLSERISVENFLALKYGHISFSNVVPTLEAYKSLTNNTGVYSGWYNIWNEAQYAFYNTLWVGPGLGQYIVVDNLVYFGILYTNANTNLSSGYANRNNYRVTYNIKTPANISKMHVLCGAGGGGGGSGSIGGGGGAGGMCYIANGTNLSSLIFNVVIGARGRLGKYFSTWQPASGGDTAVSWTINSSINSLACNGGNQGPSNSSVGGIGGSFLVTNVNAIGTTGGGNGGNGIQRSPDKPPGGAIFTPTNQIFNYSSSGTTNLWNIASAFGVKSQNIGDWYTYVSTGNGGGGSGTGGGYARDANNGGDGWVLFVYDNNV